MSHAIHPLHRHAAVQPTWTQRFARWLRRGWQARCARAERPTRVVPYY